MKKLTFTLPLLLLTLISLGCSRNKTEAMTRGRLKYIVTKSPAGGGHGWGSWKVSNQEFYVNHQKWSPETLDLAKIEGALLCQPE